MPSTHDNPHHARRWAILGVIALAQLMVVLDATIVNIALPSAQADLGFGDGSRQWVITAYALAFGSLLLLGGRIGDLFGRKWTFVVGLGGFAVASAIGGAAGSFEVLVGARALQGVFAAILAPSALGLLTTTFIDPQERAKAFGIYGAIAAGGSAVGLLLGGALTEWLSWRWCLYVNLAFAIAAAGGGLALLHNVRPQARPRIDIPGTLTACAGLFALVYGFAHAETTSWTNATTVGMLAAAVVLIGAFFAIQRRVAHPLLPLRVVLDRNRGGAFLAIGTAGMAIFGVFLFLTFYLQRTLGLSPIQTGLSFLPMTAAIMLTSTTVSTRIAPRIGARPVVVTGMALGTLAMLWFAQLGVDSSYAAHVLPGLVLMGMGMGCIFATSFANATLGVDPRDAGVASAMVSTMQQVGGSIGTALLSTLAASASSSYVQARTASPDVVAQAAVHGYATAFYVSAGIFAVGAVLCGALLQPKERVTAAAGAGVPAGAH